MLGCLGCGRLGFETGRHDSGQPIDAVDADSAVDAVDVICPPTFLLKTTGCYRSVGQQRTASVAAAECASSQPGAHLVVIESAAEQAEVRSLGPGTYWLGLVDVGSGLVWVTGGSPTYTDWQAGDPMGNACARVLATADDWDDEECYMPQMYVCELDGRAAVVSPP